MEGAEDELILREPTQVVGVELFGLVITGALGDELGRRRSCAIYIAVQLLGTEDRHDLGFPQEEVLPIQANGNGVPDSRSREAGHG